MTRNLKTSTRMCKMSVANMVRLFPQFLVFPAVVLWFILFFFKSIESCLISSFFVWSWFFMTYCDCVDVVFLVWLSYSFKFDTGNIASLVIPRPSPTGEQVPGLGKVLDLYNFLCFEDHKFFWSFERNESEFWVSHCRLL